uniref:Cytoplasmic protein n=1 Tax=Ganoderma boninense TaxID=34458 RepID=A0A5K1K039_9APHY|nr:Putative cytoplasmic protein [Ganoderma boninense]
MLVVEINEGGQGASIGAARNPGAAAPGAMEDIVEGNENVGGAEADGPGLQESMEIDDADGLPRRRSSDTLESEKDGQGGDNDGFEDLGEGGEIGSVFGGFIDVEAHVEDEVVARKEAKVTRARRRT